MATHVLWVCCKKDSWTSDLHVGGLMAIFLSNRMVFSKFASMCFPCVCAMFGRIATTCVVFGMRAVDHVPSDSQVGLTSLSSTVEKQTCSVHIRTPRTICFQWHPTIAVRFLCCCQLLIAVELDSDLNGSRPTRGLRKSASLIVSHGSGLSFFFTLFHRYQRQFTRATSS